MNLKTIAAAAMAGLLCMAAIAPVTAAPARVAIDFPFDTATARGGAATFSFKVSTAGCIVAQVTTLSPSNATVRLDLSNSRTVANKTIRQSSIGTTWLTAPVPASAANGSTWRLSVSAPTGSAKGSVRIEYPPTQVPCEFTAAARGSEVTLSWTAPARPSGGTFLVERSDATTRPAWRAVRGCNKPARESQAFRCAESGVSNGAYLYRACLVSSGSRCGTTNVTPPLAVTVRR